MITVNKFIKRSISKGFLIQTLILSFSCSPDLTDDPIPRASFPDINITVSMYPALGSNGGHILINDGGFRGIILYRKNPTTYLAFERNCSYHPNDACATVEVHSSTFYMYDPCCGSTFDFEGEPTGPPAWRPLRQYQTHLAASTLTITDEIID